MDVLLFSVLKDTPALQEKVDRRIYRQGSLGIGETPPEPQLPYILVTELPDVVHQQVRETGTARDRTFQLHVFDKAGSFQRIKEIIEVLRETVRELPTMESTSGAFCIDALWQGVSQDITGIDEKKCSKFATVTMTSSK
jgi:hypothetical protein